MTLETILNEIDTFARQCVPWKQHIAKNTNLDLDDISEFIDDLKSMIEDAAIIEAEDEDE